MATAQHGKQASASPRILCVRKTEPSWVALTLGLGQAGVEPPRICWTSTAPEALSLLRREPFDCLLIDVSPLGGIRRDESEPFELIRAIRAVGIEAAIVVVSPLLSDAHWAACCETDCEAFISARGWESAALGGFLLRAESRAARLRENRRLSAAHRRRLIRENEEAEQLLAQQRRMIADLESLASMSPVSPAEPRCEAHLDQVADRYEELLRAYVVTGPETHSQQVSQMAGVLSTAGIAPSEALQLHVRSVERVVDGLGGLSARHVMSRADLLAVELMAQLASSSQRRARGSISERTRTGGSFRNPTDLAGIDLTQLDG